MSQPPHEPHEVDDEALAESVHDAAEAAGPMSQDRAQRFYDRVRGNIQRFIDRKGKALGKTAGFLLLVPDVFILLWRLTNDSRVTGKNKVLLVSGIGYFLFPFDLIPEGLLGPVGYLDDLVFGVYVLNRILNDTDVSVVREHWSGSEDVLETAQRVLNAADELVGSQLVARIKRIVNR